MQHLTQSGNTSTPVEGSLKTKTRYQWWKDYKVKHDVRRQGVPTILEDAQ